MTSVRVIVEGPTEQSFVRELVAPVLWPRQIHLTASVLGVLGHKGGRPNYARVRKDILRHLGEDRSIFCSTMLDLYGLGRGFPGAPLPPNLTSLAKVTRLESAMKEDIIAQIPKLRADVRFLPYLQLHEFEGLLFSDPEAFANCIGRPDLVNKFRAVRQAFRTPEEIDDRPESAPSKRILQLYSSYSKVLDGTRAASAVGVEIMRRECPHFREWIERLESLAANQ